MLPRRTILKSDATLGAASLTGMAGCLDTFESDTDIQAWLADPFILPDQPNQYEVGSFAPATIDGYADELNRDAWRDIESEILDTFGFMRLFIEDIDRLIEANGGWGSDGYSVMVGDFDVDDIDRDLDREGFRVPREYGGYEVYEHEDAESAIAVSSSSLIGVTNDDDDPVRFTERVIDTNAGEERRYTDVEPAFEEFIDAVTVGDWFLGKIEPDDPEDETDIDDGEFRDAIGGSFSAELSSEESQAEVAVMFLDDRGPDERDLEDWTREDDLFNRWREIDIAVDGRFGFIRGEIRNRDLFDW